MGRKPSCKAKSAKGGRKAVPNKCFLPLPDVEEKVRSRGSKNKKGFSNDNKMQLLEISTRQEMNISQADFVYFEDLAGLVCLAKEDRNLAIDACRELTRLLFAMFCVRKQLPTKGGGGVEGIVCQVVQRILTGEENRYVRGGKNMTAENKRVKRVFECTFDQHKTFADLDAKLTTIRRASYSYDTNSSYSMCYDEEDVSEAMIRSRPYNSSCSSYGNVYVKQETFVARSIPYVKEEPVYQRPATNHQSFVPFVKAEPVYQEETGHGNNNDGSTCSLFESETASIASEDEHFEEAAAAVSAINVKEEAEEQFFSCSSMDIPIVCVACLMDEVIICEHCSICALQLFGL